MWNRTAGNNFSWAVTAFRIFAVVLFVSLAILTGGWLMRSRRAGKRGRAFGCFLYSAGLWIIVRGLIGGIGTLMVVVIFFWEQWEKIGEEQYKKLVERLLESFGIVWLLVFAAAGALLAKIGEGLRKLSEKGEELACFGFRLLLRSHGPTVMPVADNNAESVLAYRSIWEETFNAGGHNVNGWRFRDLRERLELIYFSPRVTSINPGTAVPGAIVVLTGSGFTEARSVHFGLNPAVQIVADSDTQITATLPHGNGMVEVIVTNRAGMRSNHSAASLFQYFVPPPPALKP